MSKQGLFVVVDGGEGTGTSTITKWLASDRGFVSTREPGGSPFGEEIRDLALHSKYAKDADAETLFALMWAARRDHMNHTVIPALERGMSVVSDRFDSSTWAYQIRGQQAWQMEHFFYVMRQYYLQREPNLYVILDASPEVGLARVAERKGKAVDHFDSRSITFHNRVREGYLEFIKDKPHVVINATQPLSKVKAAVWQSIQDVKKSCD